MPRKAKQSAHATLDELRQQAAGERVKARELEAELEAAKTEVETASDAIAEAYAAENQRAVTAARKTEQAAAAKVKETQHRLAGAEIRVGRAQAEADTFQAEHASHLLEEREAEARELAVKLTGAGSEAVRLHRAYLAMRMEIDSLVAAVPGATSRADGPEPSHPWERPLRDLERAVQDTPEVPAPLPRWAGLEHRKQQDNANAIEKQRRSGELSADDQAALAIGRVVTVK
jgi:chromosome segregation ATPase